jgi:3-dehydroquinate synthase
MLMRSSWSPFHELQPNPPLRHGHAISIDMAYTATLALDRGMLSKEEHTRILKLFSRAGLSIDHELYDDTAIEKGTAAILKTRDGSLRLAVPSPLGSCEFVNEFTVEDLQRVLKVHKKHAAGFARGGNGVEAYVDASDTGVPTPTPTTNGKSNGTNGHSNGTNGYSNGTNGHFNGVNGKSNSVKKAAPVQDAHGENGGIDDMINEAMPVQKVRA